MKYLLLLFVLPMMSFSDCNNNIPQPQNNEPAKDSIPACIRKIIRESGSHNQADTPTQIDEYRYKGKKVFLFSMPCCDQFNMLYDDKCKAICAPSGGITGRGDQQCADFKDSAKFVRKVWVNRKK